MTGSPAQGRVLACKIIYVINHAAFFVSHRLPLALEAIRRGHTVLLATGQAGSEEMERSAELELVREGIAHHRVAFTATGINPFVELRGLFQLIRTMRRERPDLIHCASPKGILYGAIAARVSGCRALVIAVSGMGYAFSSDPAKSLLRGFSAFAYRSLARFAYAHRNKMVIVQNSEDRQQIINAGLASDDEVILIPGSGVDVRALSRLDPGLKSDMVLFAGRMIREKGVMEFAEAARIVKRTYPNWRFVMAGAADYHSPSSVSAEILRKLQAEGCIEWLGLTNEMTPLYAGASIFCLPSYYREGIPKVLLEAAAAGCAVITTDLPGCREAIVAGETGDLVPARDSTALANSLIALISDRQRRESYAANGRQLAAERFDIRFVVSQVNDVYEKLIASGS